MRRSFLTSKRVLIAALLLATGAGAPPTAQAQKTSQPQPLLAGLAGETPLAPFTWKDVSGKGYDFGTIKSGKATVFFFSSTQCPISNIYTPRMKELAAAYTPKGVRFFLVNSNQEDSLKAVKQYAKERQFPFPAVKDNGARLADWLAADRTPEAVVVDNRGVARYRGRIDDNQDRMLVFRRDVKEALDAILAGKPVARPRTVAFGCVIFRDSGAKIAAPSAEAVTYSRDVAPILYKNCVSCHRKGDVGPFALETYAQARTWASAIKDYTTRRIMPPWKAAPGHGDFVDARNLNDDAIATLARWADSKAPQGNLKDLPPMPQFPDPNAWPMGTPDMTLRPVRPYHVGAEGRDIYREFVLPVDFKTDRYLRGIDFKPDNRAIVHHIIVYLDPTGKTAQMDGKETEPGYTVPGVGIGIQESVFLQGWAPGNSSSFLPDGTAMKIPAGSKLVLQVHYHKNGKESVDQSAVGLHFARGSVDKVMQVWAAVNAEFVLKPGVAEQPVHAGFKLPVDIHVWGVSPHMHMLGRSMKLTATLPDGSKKTMIFVNDWDFNWQETYRYKAPLALPAGTNVEVEAIFDNSDRNPRQHSHPPREIRFGEQTTDEMCIGFFVVTIDKEKLGVQLDSASGAPLTGAKTASR